MQTSPMSLHIHINIPTWRTHELERTSARTAAAVDSNSLSATVHCDGICGANKVDTLGIL